MAQTFTQRPAPTLPQQRTTSTVVVQSEVAPTPQRFGAKGNGVDDDTAAIASLLAANYSAVRFPPGVYNTNSTLNVGRDTSADLRGATIKATATIAGAVLEVGDEIGWWRDKYLMGGKVDCNNLAQKGILVRRGYSSKLDQPTIANAKAVWLQLGDPSSSVSCHEVNVMAAKGESDFDAPAGSVGMWATSKCADSQFWGCTMVGAQDSFFTEGGRNTHFGSHGWGGYTAQLPRSIFKEGGSDNGYIGCYADTPTSYGWWLTASAWRTQIVNPWAYMHSNGPDNAATAFYTDVPYTNGLSIISPSVVGYDSSHRWANDYNGVLSPQALLVIPGTGTIVNSQGVNLRIAIFGSVNINRLRNAGTIPSAVANGAALGTSPPAATLRSTSRDVEGIVSLGSGTSPAAGTVATITYGTPFSLKPFATVAPASAAAADMGLYVDDAASSATQLVIGCRNAPAASQSAGAILIDFRTSVTGA